MDAFAQLALMAKAQRVFTSPDTFLSFPALSPLSFAPDQLRFGSDADMTREDLIEAQEFARFANQVPRDVLAPVIDGEPLWAIVRDVLDRAEVAATTPTTDEQARYAAARDLLYVDAGEVGQRDSPALLAYRQYRDASFALAEDFRNREMTAQASEDPVVRRRWDDVEEPQLRSQLDELEREWASVGQRDAVEGAIETVRRLSGSRAAATWGEWRRSLDDAIDLQTGLDNATFAPTGFSPFDIFDHDDWPTFTLTRSEMTQLADEAPAALRDIFAATAHESDIERVTFENRSVALTRPWFHADMFRERFWRLPPGAPALSDAADPPSGRCPAYIAALVFARNVVVTRRGKPPQAVRGTDATLSPMVMAVASMSPRVAKLARATPAVRRPAAILSASAAPASIGLVEPARPATTLTMRARPAATVPPSASATLSPTLLSTSVARSLALTRFSVRPQTLVATTLAPPPDPPPATSTTNELGDEMMILAFICKRLPRCPDPDPALDWS